MIKRLLVFLLILNYGFVWSQLCGGSFGDPVFKEDFGSVDISTQNISPALVSPAYTSYEYTTKFPPDDGFYTIANLTGRGAANWAWITIPDHTEDPIGKYGNMLIVNASYEPGEFYRRRVSNLCPNQVFLFSAWGINLNTKDANDHHDPDVTIQIRDVQGNVLVSSNKVLPRNEQWQEFSVEFRSAVGSGDVDVVLINNAVGGMGNDLAIDDISFRPCGPTLSTVTNTNVFTGVCDNILSVEMKASIQSNAITDPTYIWQKSTDKGISWQDLTAPTSSSTYIIPARTYQNGDLFRYVVAESTNINSLTCRIASTPMEAKVFGYPQAPKLDPILVCKNSNFVINIPGQNILYYTSPTGGVGTSNKPNINTSQISSYRFWVTQTVNGCESQRTEIVVQIIDLPSSPIVKNVSFCQNSVAKALEAIGTSLKWYSGEFSNDGSSVAPIPSTVYAGETSYWVSQTNNSCKSPRSEIKVTILPIENSKTLSDITICDGESKILDAGNGFLKYEWNTNPPTFSQYLRVSELGEYEVKLTNTNGCVVTQKVNVFAGVTPEIKQILTGDTFIEVHAEGGNPPYYYSIDGLNWQTNNRFEQLNAGIFKVLVKSQTNSCTAIAEAQVIFIPNVITPNGDGRNDVFRIKNIEFYKEAHLIISDRYGKEVFSSKKENTLEWNGKFKGRNLPSDTYWYFLDLGNGFTKSGWIMMKNR